MAIERPLGYSPGVDLDSKQKQHLRALAHSIKPLVQVGTKGLTESLIEQIAAQLLAHELIKVRFNTESTVEPADSCKAIVEGTKSQLVQASGRILVLYRRHDQKPKIQIPKPTRR